MDFINSELNGHTTLSSEAGSGKTSAILLKSILEKLKHPEDKIIIIKPTILACDILKKRLLNTIEHAIVEIDITSIEIITPIRLLNRHLSKLGKPELDNSI
jgi:phage terminase large subunit